MKRFQKYAFNSSTLLKVMVLVFIFQNSIFAQPTCLLDNVGMSKMFGDGDNQAVGDITSDDEDDDDFISFANFGSTSVDISGWELYVDQDGSTTPVFTFPASTILVPNQEVTVISDWNEGDPLPTNWFDANFASGEGLFEETSNEVTYAILKNPTSGNYITIHNMSSTPSLSSGTQVCEYNFSSLVPDDFDGCEMIYWNAVTSTYIEITDCTIPNLPGGSGSDTDGDGVANELDSDSADPCVPIQTAGYTGYDASNMTWSNANCDGDAVSNGQELTDNTDPYDASSVMNPDGDGDGYSGAGDPDDADPCVPDANNLACPTGDFDNDGAANSTDADPSDPCVPDANSLACATGDYDGDGVANSSDTAPSDPCVPAQSSGYTGYDATNAIWAAADCDSDGTNNGTEVTNSTDPYVADSSCNAGTTAPILINN